jgi:hypothetical protein
MDDLTGRADHIEDYLVTVRTGQWFGWAKGAEPRKVYANLIVHDGGSKPTEQECIDGLVQMQTDFDSLDYARKREAEYPSVQDLVVALYDTDDKAAIEAKRAEIKLKYPKP